MTPSSYPTPLPSLSKHTCAYTIIRCGETLAGSTHPPQRDSKSGSIAPDANLLLKSKPKPFHLFVSTCHHNTTFDVDLYLYDKCPAKRGAKLLASRDEAFFCGIMNYDMHKRRDLWINIDGRKAGEYGEFVVTVECSRAPFSAPQG